MDKYPQIIFKKCWLLFQMNNYSLTEVGSDIIYWISGFKTSHTMKVMINDAAILTRRNSGGILEGKKRCLLLGAFLVFNWDALYLQGLNGLCFT